MRDFVQEWEGQGLREQRGGHKDSFLPIRMLELFYLEALGKKNGPEHISCLHLFSWTPVGHELSITW